MRRSNNPEGEHDAAVTLLVVAAIALLVLYLVGA